MQWLKNDQPGAELIGINVGKGHYDTTSTKTNKKIELMKTCQE